MRRKLPSNCRCRTNYFDCHSRPNTGRKYRLQDRSCNIIFNEDIEFVSTRRPHFRKCEFRRNPANQSCLTADGFHKISRIIRQAFENFSRVRRANHLSSSFIADLLQFLHEKLLRFNVQSKLYFIQHKQSLLTAGINCRKYFEQCILASPHIESRIHKVTDLYNRQPVSRIFQVSQVIIFLTQNEPDRLTHLIFPSFGNCISKCSGIRTRLASLTMGNDALDPEKDNCLPNSRLIIVPFTALIFLSPLICNPLSIRKRIRLLPIVVGDRIADLDPIRLRLFLVSNKKIRKCVIWIFSTRQLKSIFIGVIRATSKRQNGRLPSPVNSSKGGYRICKRYIQRIYSAQTAPDKHNASQQRF